MTDQGIPNEPPTETPSETPTEPPSETSQGAHQGSTSEAGRSDRLLSLRVIVIASAVALLVLGGVAAATLTRDGSGDKAGPATSSTGVGSRISGASGVSGSSGSQGGGPSGTKKGGVSGSSAAGSSGNGATGTTETTLPSDEEADIAKIRVAINPGTCLWDLDTF